MYPVSNAFLQAVQENTRKYYWTGKGHDAEIKGLIKNGFSANDTILVLTKLIQKARFCLRSEMHF